MTRKERRDYILNLHNVTKRWRENSKLFRGGCCFSAGQIAEMLEKKGIRYNVICWQYTSYSDKTAKTLKNMILRCQCLHVGIAVYLDGETFIIGGRYYSPNSIKRKLSKTKSETLIKCDIMGAELDLWNWEYNRNLNSRYMKSLTKSVEK